MGQRFGRVLVDSHVGKSQKKEAQRVQSQIQAEIGMADPVLNHVVGEDPGGFDAEVQENSQADILKETVDRYCAYPINYATEITWFF
jgi:hypothetical protein